MIITGISPLQAPTTTGHPASLPSAPVRQTNETRVAPTRQGEESSGAALRQRQSGQSDPRMGRRGTEAASAPPTILQLKINSMLLEQADNRQSQDTIRDPAPAPGTTQAKTEPDRTGITISAPPETARQGNAEQSADGDAARDPHLAAPGPFDREPEMFES